VIRAIFRAQLLSMRPPKAGAGRRGLIFSLIVAVVWYGFWASLAWLAFGFTAAAETAPWMPRYLPLGLLFVFLYWQLAPLVSAGLGASLDLRKLLVYPVPHDTLFVIEVLLRLTTSAEMLLILGGGTLGLLVNPVLGGWRAAPRLWFAVLLFTMWNLLLAAGLRNLIERLLARRRIREMVILVLVAAAASPRLLMALGVSWGRIEGWLAYLEGVWMPWTAAANAQLGIHTAASLAVLTGWVIAAGVFGRLQFERSLSFDAQAAQATEAVTPRGAGWSERFYRLPSAWLPDPVAAVVEKELRSLSRTPRFRTVFMMGFTLGMVVWLPLIVGGRARQPGGLADNFLVVVSVYALILLGQVSYWNSFGFDRSAAGTYFTAPIHLAKVLAGKNLAAALFILFEVTAVTGACLLLRVNLPALKIVEAYAVTPVCALYMLAIGNLASVHFARGMSPERVAQGSSANRFQGVLFLVYPVTMLPVMLAYLARYAFGSQLAFWGVLAFAAALGAAFYWIAMDSAVHAAIRRRDLFLMELGNGAGPVVTE